MVFSLSDLIGIVSLLVSVIALILSIVALNISREVVVYSSKDYEPQLDVTIDDNSEVTVINRSKKLFKLISVSFIEVKTVGYEDNEQGIVVRMPLLIKSKHCPYIEGQRRVFITEETIGPCAFQLCPIKKEFVKNIDDKIYKEYLEPFVNGESQKGYAYPSFQSIGFYVVVTYENKFQEHKNAYFNKQHYHGSGYVNSKVSYEQLENYLKYIDTPKFEDFDSLWNYMVERYKVSSDEFWKASV